MAVCPDICPAALRRVILRNVILIEGFGLGGTGAIAELFHAARGAVVKGYWVCGWAVVIPNICRSMEIEKEYQYGSTIIEHYV